MTAPSEVEAGVARPCAGHEPHSSLGAARRPPEPPTLHFRIPIAAYAYGAAAWGVLLAGCLAFKELI